MIFFVIIAQIAWVCYKKPAYNWDTLAYMAILLNGEEDDVVKIHQTTYKVAEAEIPADKYRLMTDTSHAVKKDVLNNPAKFFQYTSFFRIKPFYTGLSYLAYKGGIPLSKAPVVPSVFSFIAISLLLVWSFNKFFTGWLTALLSLCIMVSPPVLEAARLATPDALSTLIILFAFYLLLESSSWGWIIFVLSLSILVRVDNIMLALIVICFQAFTPISNAKGKIPGFVFWGAAAIWILYAFWIMNYANIQNGFENFYGGLYKKANPLTVLREAVIGINTVQTSHLSIVLSITAVILFYKRPFTFKSLNQRQLLFLMLMIYLVVRYTIFPDLTTRFYLPVYIMSVVLALEAIPEFIRERSIT